MTMKRDAGVRQFEATWSDLGRYAVGKWKLDTHAGSPLAAVCADPGAVSQPSIQALKAFGEDAELKRALTILTRPDHVMTIRLGGGALGYEEATLSHANAMGDFLVMLGATEQGNAMVTVFSGPDVYAGWWMERYGGKNTETVPNPAPPRTTLGEFLIVLHAVDSFRRASYRSLLDYAPGVEPSVGYKEFFDTFQQAVRSKDIRWLLPAFLMLTPGLDKHEADFTQGSVEVLNRLDLVRSGKNQQTGEDRMLFTSNLRGMGVAVFRSWMMAMGCEITACSDTARTSHGSFFVAPTALANHFVTIEKDERGKSFANHQADTALQTEERLAALVRGMMLLAVPKAAPAPASPSAPAANGQKAAAATAATNAAVASTATAATASTATAAATAATAAPGAAGAGQTPGSAFCHKCGNPLRPEERFCVSCGTPRAEKKG